jgi:hypothetical protein
LGPLGTAATNRPIVQTPGRMIGREVLGDNLPQCNFAHHKPHKLPGREHGPPRWEASD